MPPKTDLEIGDASCLSEPTTNSMTERFIIQTKYSDEINPNKDGSVDDNCKSRSTSTSFKAVTACLLYSFCSVSMIIVNKSLTSSYNDLIAPDATGEKRDLKTLLVVFQAAAAVGFLWACKWMNLLDVPMFVSWNTLKSWAPVNIFFCLMLFTSMAALETNSVPMVTVFKNVANITTATADYFFFGNLLEPLSITAFAVMLFGAVAASWNGIETSFIGLGWMILNCLSTTGYVCYMRYATQNIKMTKFGMVYINNILCVVFLAPVAWINGEVSRFVASTALHTWDYGLKNVFAGFVGFFLNAASLHCVSMTGPTTYAIVGSLNKVPVTFFGWFLFQEKLSGKTWFFIGISLLGGFLYTYAKIRAKQQGINQLARSVSSMPLEPNSNQESSK